MVNQPGDATFEELQAGLVRRLEHLGVSELTEGTVVVLPSITFPPEELQKIVGIERYEERMLFALLLLSRPKLQLVYLTSCPIDPTVIDYYLSFTCDPAGARRRLRLISLDDPEQRALTEKILERPEAIEAITRAVPDRDNSYILPFNVTEAEADLATRLGVPVYGPHPDMARLGSKSGSRAIARRAGVPVFEGAEDLYALEDIEEVIEHLRVQCSYADAVVIKLNNGFSGQGNAIVDLRGPTRPLVESRTVFCASEESWRSYASKIVADGAIVEELERSPNLVSPSVQLRIAPGGFVEIVSSHDQVLGGPDDQVYLGCRFPADAAYRSVIQRHARSVGEVLAGEGVIGSFGIDFVVVPEGDGHRVVLSEINLRLGGTSHPYLMTSLATGHTYDESSGRLVVDGEPRYYFATDNLKSGSYVGVTPERVIAAIAGAGLAFDPATNRGVMLHLLGALREYGKFGMTCIASSRERAAELYDEAVAAVDATAAVAR